MQGDDCKNHYKKGTGKYCSKEEGKENAIFVRGRTGIKLLCNALNGWYIKMSYYFKIIWFNCNI